MQASLFMSCNPLPMLVRYEPHPEAAPTATGGIILMVRALSLEIESS
jgi:hypothetical protein